MTIHTAHEALVIWGEYAFSGGAPVGLLKPKGDEKPGPVHGFTDEEQVVAFVERVEGFNHVRRALFAVWAMQGSIDEQPISARVRIAEFRAILQDRIGKGWHTIPPTAEWCPADEPKVTVTNDGKTVLK